LKPRSLLTFVLSLIITAGFLTLALYRVDFNRFVQAFAAADYRLVVIAAGLTCCGYVLRTVRWQRLLFPTKKIALKRLFPVLVIGFALNNLLPGRPGEFARGYAVGKRENISRTLGFATVVLERVADGIALIAVLLITLALFSRLGIDLPPAAETVAVLASGIFGIALAGLLFLLLRESLALTIFQFFTRFLPHTLAARLERMLSSFVLGLHSLKSIRDVAVVVFSSLGIWACEATSYFLILSAFGALPRALDHVVAAAFMMVLINLGIMIPAAPGGVGPFEAAGIFALSTFGVNESLAASVSITAHAMQYLLITGMGLIFVWHEGISLAQAREGGDE
jgi:glycosyltransferase 2 family protein